MRQICQTLRSSPNCNPSVTHRDSHRTRKLGHTW